MQFFQYISNNANTAGTAVLVIVLLVVIASNMKNLKQAFFYSLIALAIYGLFLGRDGIGNALSGIWQTMLGG